MEVWQINVVFSNTLFLGRERTVPGQVKTCLHRQHKRQNISERSSDTDVLVLILVMLSILFDTGTGNKRRLVNVKQTVEVIVSDLCLTLTALHCFAGCKIIRFFMRRSNRSPLKVLEKFPEFMDVFCVLGEKVTCSSTLLNDLERFIC